MEGFPFKGAQRGLLRDLLYIMQIGKGNMKHFNHGTVKGSLEATKVAGGLKETIITNKGY